MRTAVFGGTFDPVHTGHIKMAKQAIDEFSLSELVIVPNGTPPHKANSGTTPFFHRYNMLSLAFEGVGNVTISDYEASEKNPSYSVDTMRHFRQVYGEDTFFILGADSLLGIDKWYKHEELLRENSFIVFRRKGDRNLHLVAGEFKKKYGTNILFADMDYVDISSTMVRTALESDSSCDGLLPDSVIEYIRRNGLYTDTCSGVLKRLRTVLTEQRLCHTTGVADTASELARIHGVDKDKAYLAALLHDCAKCYTKQELLKKIEHYGIELDEASADAPQLWHSFVGAYEAEYVYGIEDKDIFNAIFYHTIGRVGMSPLEKIIYLADAIEPSRNFDRVDYLRALSARSLSEAVAEYTQMSIDFVISRGLKVHPNAYKVAAFYRRQK